MRHRIGHPVEDAVSQDVPWLASDLDHSTNAAHTCFTVVRALSGGDGRRSRITSRTPDQMARVGWERSQRNAECAEVAAPRSRVAGEHDVRGRTKRDTRAEGEAHRR